MANEYIEPVIAEINKNSQVDFNVGWRLVRTITAIEAPVLTPGLLHRTLAAQCFKSRCEIVGVRIFSDVSASNPSVRIISESPPGGPLTSDKQLPSWSQPCVPFIGDALCDGMTCVNFNPFTGVADATTWYACGEFTADAAHCAALVGELPAGPAANYEKRFVVQCFGEEYWYPYVSSLDTATTVLVAMKPIS